MIWKQPQPHTTTTTTKLSVSFIMLKQQTRYDTTKIQTKHIDIQRSRWEQKKNEA